MDWKLILTLGITAINLIILVVIKINDLKHLEEDVHDLKLDMKHYIQKLYKLAQRVSNLEGRSNSKR